jgi:hypothetical protein
MPINRRGVSKEYQRVADGAHFGKREKCRGPTWNLDMPAPGTDTVSESAKLASASLLHVAKAGARLEAKKGRRRLGAA